LEDPGVNGGIILKMDIKEVGWGGKQWIDLAQDMDRWWAIVNEVINIRVPYDAKRFLTSWRPVSFSGRTLLQGISLSVSRSVG
jgi:hypothetical protein